MPKKNSSKSISTAPAGKPGQQRWSDLWPSKPFVEKRIASRIGGDTGSMDKVVKKPKGK